MGPLGPGARLHLFFCGGHPSMLHLHLAPESLTPALLRGIAVSCSGSVNSDQASAKHTHPLSQRLPRQLGPLSQTPSQTPRASALTMPRKGACLRGRRLDEEGPGPRQAGGVSSAASASRNFKQAGDDV
ncbi:unnamed protein product [Arctogadus glacialis]